MKGKTHYGSVDRANESDTQDYWSNTLCGLEYHESPMSDRIEYVTCKNCKKIYTKRLKDFIHEINPFPLS